MPPRPFPFPLSIGTDIVHVKRIHDILLRAQNKPQHRERFLRRFLTPGEVVEFQTRFGDGTDSIVVSKHLAGRWAAKEAAIKAVTWRRLSFHDVIVWRTRAEGSLQAVILDELRSISGQAPAGRSGADAVSTNAVQHLPGQRHEGIKAADDQAGLCDAISPPQRRGSLSKGMSGLEGQIAKISVSHDGDYATAVCLAAEEQHEMTRCE